MNKGIVGYRVREQNGTSVVEVPIEKVKDHMVEEIHYIFDKFPNYASGDYLD